MKKIFLFLAALVGIVACSKGDSGSSDNGGGGSVAGYNPPDWIIGTWMDTNNSTGFKFTSNNFCQIAAGASNCFLEGPYVTVTESKATNKSFSFTFKIASTEFSYVFEQLEGGKVKTTNRGILNDVYIKQK